MPREKQEQTQEYIEATADNRNQAATDDNEHDSGCQETHLTGRWSTNGAGPVVVHVCHLVRQALHVVCLKAGGVVQHRVVSGRHRTLAHMLADQEEVVPANKRQTDRQNVSTSFCCIAARNLE